MKNKIAKFRIEQDSIGPIRVPIEKYWGAQTQRALENFKIGTECLHERVTHITVLRSEGGLIFREGGKLLQLVLV